LFEFFVYWNIYFQKYIFFQFIVLKFSKLVAIQTVILVFFCSKININLLLELKPSKNINKNFYKLNTSIVHICFTLVQISWKKVERNKKWQKYINFKINTFLTNKIQNKIKYLVKYLYVKLLIFLSIKKESKRNKLWKTKASESLEIVQKFSENIYKYLENFGS
jgi:hypothetical protein